MKKLSFILISFLSMQTAIATDLQYTCTQNNCVIYADTQNNGRVVIFPNIPNELIQTRIALKQYNQSLGSVHSSCGMYCGGDVFVNLVNGQKSDPYDLVMAVDPTHNLVAYPSNDNTAIEISNIFNSSKTVSIKRNFAEAVVLPMVANVEFSGSNIILNYFDQNNNTQSETIPLNYSQLGLSNS